MRKFLTKILGDPNVRVVKKLRGRVDAINALEAQYKKKSDTGLRKVTDELKLRLKKGETLDDILPDAFAAVRETARRTLGQRHFDVQLMGGMALHEGKIAEMRTGEGKTLVATLPVYLNALAGKGVHVVTVNDFLAQRDAGWMAQIYHFLGLNVGVIIGGNKAVVYDPEYTDEGHEDERLQHLKPVEKKEAYAADITYGTNNEFGFDYLRDNMASSLENYVQRGLSFAIVDEVDSILIDEARTPLIISAPATENAANYQQFSVVASQLNHDTDFAVDEKAQAATLTDDGVVKVQQVLGIDNLYDAAHVQLIYHIEQALKAEALFKRDKDYVVRNGQVIIVDEFTGRLLEGRRYNEGLHQAIEAKESVPILQESMTLATISFQNYFRLYGKLSGMTGTAATEAEEFQTVYDLDVVVIPTNKDMVRDDMADRIYKTEVAKYRAIVADVAERHQKGQPVLIGTVSIEKNELLSNLLKQAKIPHEVLNAKNNEKEAAIVAAAGKKGGVTLATNIAGRGTDIVLGEGVTNLGGLHVLGSERHESRRIDNQLRGRAGRQGDAGSSQFYVSLEDELMRVFGGERIAGLMNTLKVDEDTPIENSIVSRALESAQKRIENHNFDIRKQVLQYDDVMNRHRSAIYARRRQILEAKNLRDEILNMVENEVQTVVQSHIDARTETLSPQAVEVLATVVPLPQAERKKLVHKNQQELVSEVNKLASTQYKQREQEFGTETMRNLERLVYLQIMDRLWMEHLENMQHLREGIRLRAVGQRDPLVEYKREAFGIFNTLNETIEREVASTIFKLSPAPPQTAETPQEAVQTDLTEAAEQASTTAPDESGRAHITTNAPAKAGDKVGRNDPCPCGSGKKYKKCGLLETAEHQARMKGQAGAA